MAESKNTGRRGQFQQEKKRTKESLKSISQELKDQLVSYNKIDEVVNKILNVKNMSLAAAKSSLDIDKKTTKESLAKNKLDEEALEYAVEYVKNTKESLAGFKQMIVKAKAFGMILKSNPIFAIAAILIAIVGSLVSAFKAARELQRELGTGLIQSGLIAAKLKAVEFSLIGMDVSAEQVRASFDAISENLGGIEQASFGFLRNFTRLSQVTGVQADDLASILSIQESVSDASRDALMSQIEANAEVIRLQGLAPGAVFKDIASNAEFFATSMKAGTNNVMKTAIEARKLGLNLSTVAKISESLLDFESSIEKQMEASVLLGRQLNLDKARQLSFMDDQEGMMREILRQVGGEAEFERLKGFQRRALADAVGVDVAELAKLARQQEGAATGVAVAKTTEEKSLSVQEKSLNVLFDIRDNSKDQVKETRKTNQELTAGG